MKITFYNRKSAGSMAQASDEPHPQCVLPLYPSHCGPRTHSPLGPSLYFTWASLLTRFCCHEPIAASGFAWGKILGFTPPGSLPPAQLSSVWLQPALTSTSDSFNLLCRASSESVLWPHSCYAEAAGTFNFFTVRLSYLSLDPAPSLPSPWAASLSSSVFLLKRWYKLLLVKKKNRTKKQIIIRL